MSYSSARPGAWTRDLGQVSYFLCVLIFNGGSNTSHFRGMLGGLRDHLGAVRVSNTEGSASPVSGRSQMGDEVRLESNDNERKNGQGSHDANGMEVSEGHASNILNPQAYTLSTCIHSIYT